MYLPTELHKYILELISNSDKIYASMVCKLWKEILEGMFHEKYSTPNKIPNNCAYDLNMYLLNFKLPQNIVLTLDNARFIYDERAYIIISDDINTVNVLAHYLIKNNCIKSNASYYPNSSNTIYRIDWQELISFYIKNDHISKINYTIQLQTYQHNNIDGYLLNKALQHKSFKFAHYYLQKGTTCVIWIKSICWYSINNDENLNGLLETLKFLIINNSLLLPYFFDHMSKLDDFKYKDQVINFVKQYTQSTF